MKNVETGSTESGKLSRRAMLGKSAKYAALIPAASLVVTKANANGSYSGSSLAVCVARPEHNQPPADAALHCNTDHLP